MTFNSYTEISESVRMVTVRCLECGNVKTVKKHQDDEKSRKVKKCKCIKPISIRELKTLGGFDGNYKISAIYDKYVHFDKINQSLDEHICSFSSGRELRYLNRCATHGMVYDQCAVHYSAGRCGCYQCARGKQTASIRRVLG